LDDINFSYALKKMKKSRIIRLKEILSKLYGSEMNKYEIAKFVMVTPQAVGPEVDLLENVGLIKKIRIEKRRGIPAYYYTLDIDSLVDSMELDDGEKEILKDGLVLLQPAHKELKNLERVRKIPKIESTIYEGIVPTDHKMFILQFISSILIIGALIFDPTFSILPEFLKKNQQLFFILQNYSNELRDNLSVNDTRINQWIKENFKSISKIFSKIWDSLMQAIVMASIIKEPSMKIMDKLEETKSADLKRKVEEFRDYSKIKKKLEEFIDEERKEKNKCENNLRIIFTPLLEIQKRVLEDKIIENKIETVRSRLNLLSSKLRSSALGITVFNTEKEKIEAIRIKIAILKAFNKELLNFQNELTTLEQSITFENFDNVDHQLKTIYSMTQNLEKFENWHSDPRVFLEKPIEKSKIDKKDIDNRIQQLVNKLKKENVNLLSDFISKFNSEYPNIEVGQKEIINGINRLSKKSFFPYIETMKLGKKKREKIVRLNSTEKDQMEVLKLAEASSNGRVTVEAIELQLNWPVHRARIVLDDLVKNHKILFKSTRVDGDVWYIPGVK